MFNLDERYHSYLNSSKRMRIDGGAERVKAYGYTDDGKEITGHYVVTDNYKLYYDKEAVFLKLEPLKELTTIS